MSAALSTGASGNGPGGHAIPTSQAQKAAGISRLHGTYWHDLPSQFMELFSKYTRQQFQAMNRRSRELVEIAKRVFGAVGKFIFSVLFLYGLIFVMQRA